MYRLVISQLLTLTLLTGCIFDEINKEPTASAAQLENQNGTEAVEISAAELLKNVSDPDNDTLSITDVILAKGLCELTVKDDTAWIYTPSIADLGEIEFNYTATDGEAEASATVSFDIVNTNRKQILESSPVHLSLAVTDPAGQNVSTVVYTLNVLGEDHVVSSSNGNATFIGLPANTEYYLSIEDSSGQYATDYYSNITPATNQNIVQSIPISSLAESLETHLSITNVNSSETVSGLIPYLNPNTIAASNGRAVSLVIPNVNATEANNLYTFLLAASEQPYQITIDELTDDNDINYNVFGTSNSSYSDTVVAGETNHVDLSPQEQLAEFTVTYTVTNENAEALSVGGVLNVYNLDKDITENWLQSTETENLYSLTVTAENMADQRVVEPIDLDSDGFLDLIPALNQSNALGLIENLSVSQFDENKTFNTPLTIVNINTSSTSISSQLVSQTSDFKAGTQGQLLIAFDQPIQLPSYIDMYLHNMAQQAVVVDLANPAIIYQQDKTTAATTDQGESELSLNSANAYTYLDNNTASTTLTLGGGNNEITSTYVNDYQQTTTKSVLGNNQFELVANGTLLKITPLINSLEPNFKYGFEFTVQALMQNIDASMVFDVFAVSNKAEQLEDFTVDNFDFKNTTLFDPTDATKLTFLENQELHQDLFFELNVDYNTNEDRALLKYVEYTDHGFSTFADTLADLGIESTDNTLYLITQTPITGNMELTKQSESYLSSGSQEVTSTDFTDLIYELTLDALDPDKTNQIRGQKVYLFDKPSNHGINEDTVKETFNVPVASGANINGEGIYYVYSIPVSTNHSGQITNVTLKLDVSVNGAKRTGTVEYQVK